MTQEHALALALALIGASVYLLAQDLDRASRRIGFLESENVRRDYEASIAKRKARRKGKQ
jgi:hypothetical protein